MTITDEMVDRALNAWFASPPSETDQGLERSMRAALEAAFTDSGAHQCQEQNRGNRFCANVDCPYPDCLDGSVCASQSSSHEGDKP